jgi:hypothetical protein
MFLGKRAHIQSDVIFMSPSYPPHLGEAAVYDTILSICPMLFP